MVKRYYHCVLSAKGSLSSPSRYAGAAALIYRTWQDGSKSLLHCVRLSLGSTPRVAAEYITLIRSLRVLLRHFAEEKSLAKRAVLRIFSDSENDLLNKQMTGAYKVKSKHLRILHAIASGLAAAFGEIRYESCKGKQLEDVHAVSCNSAGPIAEPPSPNAVTPNTSTVEYLPNLVLLSEIWIDGQRIAASNDMHSEDDQDQCLIDAKFLASLPSYGTKVIREKIRDSAPIVALRGAYFEANVLGEIDIDFAFEFVRSRRSKSAPKNKRVFNALVVDNLPVPMHISTKHDKVREEDLPDEVEYPSRFTLSPFYFPEEYQSHVYWLDFDKSSGFDPTPYDS